MQQKLHVKSVGATKAAGACSVTLKAMSRYRVRRERVPEGEARRRAWRGIYKLEYRALKDQTTRVCPKVETPLPNSRFAKCDEWARAVDVEEKEEGKGSREGASGESMRIYIQG